MILQRSKDHPGAFTVFLAQARASFESAFGRAETAGETCLYNGGTFERVVDSD
jgi:hypothetical protein